MLQPGESVQVQGSAATPYTVKNHDGRIWSCTCPGWRNSPGKVDEKICKHVRAERGDAPTNGKTAVKTAPAVALVQTPATTTQPWYLTAAQRAAIIASEEARVGRKLRQDEKTKLFGPKILLANDYLDNQFDPTGWWWSEKLDGLRAYWDGTHFVTRGGNVFDAPDWFTKDLPKHSLDGELYLGMHMLEETVSICLSAGSGDLWKRVCYVIFDSPDDPREFEDRLAAFTQEAQTINSPYLRAHPQQKITSRAHLDAELARIAAAGGEGIMLRKPRSKYDPKRSATLQKYKPYKDAEAEVIGHVPGKGNRLGMTGSLVVRTVDGKEFNVACGDFTVCRNPPAIGTIITYQYADKTKYGVPKCASFLHVRAAE